MTNVRIYWAINILLIIAVVLDARTTKTVSIKFITTLHQ